MRKYATHQRRLSEEIGAPPGPRMIRSVAHDGSIRSYVYMEAQLSFMEAQLHAGHARLAFLQACA